MKNKINFISMKEAFKIVKEWEKNPEANRELYVAAENGKICAIDNTDGNCWTEDFRTLEEALKWLLDLEEDTAAMRKIAESTQGTHIYMKLELAGEIYEVDNYSGVDGKWEIYKTTADGSAKREAVIKAFNELY